jgi:hypothetical protein
MNPQEEISDIKRRIGAVEYELVQLKARVGMAEAGLRIGTAGTPISAPSQAATIDKPRQPVPPPVIATALPPVIRPDAPAAVEPGRNQLREWLEPLQLWPPSGEENRETRLAAWWTTRLGAALAIIGIVFFGVYVSRNTSPWVRLAELIAVAGAATAGGLWLERKVAKFGAVIVGAGLALWYFCAFSAYAIPATKVIDSAFVATGWQCLAVLLVLGAAWWRGSPVTASMAVVLGYVAAVFSWQHGSADFALFAAFLLNTAAIGLRWGRDWGAPSALASPLSWLLLASIAVDAAGDRGVSLELIWGWGALNFGLIYLRDWIPAVSQARSPASVDRAVQTVSSSLAVLVGFVATLVLRRQALGEFYFGSGALLVIAAAGWWWRSREEPLSAVYFCKAASLIALGVITECDARSRALVLLAQAWVLLFSAKRSGLRPIRTMTAVVWLVALAMFVFDVNGNPNVSLNEALLAAAIFFAGAAAAAGLHERWFGSRPGLAVTAGVLVGFAAVFWLGVRDSSGWLPMLAAGVAVLLALCGWATRGWRAPLVAATIVGVCAHGWEVVIGAGEWLWWNELVLLAGTIGAGWAIDRAKPLDEKGAGILRGLVTAVASATLVIVLAHGLPKTQAMAAAVAVALVMMAVAPRIAGWPFAALSTLVIAVGWLEFGLVAWRGGDGWLCGAAVGALLLPAWLSASVSRQATIGEGWRRVHLVSVQTALGTGIALVALQASFSPHSRLYALAVALLFEWALAWRARLRPALPAASVMVLLGMNWMLAPVTSATWTDALPVLAAAAATAAVPLLARKFDVEKSRGWSRVAAWWHAGAALVVIFTFFRHQHGMFAPYATVLWGAAAIALFLAGLFVRTRAYRLVGLAGLALCIARLFVVDLGSTLYRIVAFVALGAVLLLVGFSYHRFRHLIVNEE